MVADASATSMTASSPDANADFSRPNSASETVADVDPPPMKPRSRRWVVSVMGLLLRFHELDEAAERRLGMDERDLQAEQARARRLVAQVHALVAQAGEVRPGAPPPRRGRVPSPPP